MRGLPARLLARQLAADRWVALLLAVLVAGTTALACAALSALEDAGDRDLRQVVTELSPARRDLVATVPTLLGPATPPEQPYDDLVRGMVTGPLADLRDLAGTPSWSLRTPVLTVAGSDSPIQRLTVRTGSGWQPRMRVVAGTLPARATGRFLGPGADVQRPLRPTAIEVAVTEVAARSMGLRVGQVLPMQGAPGNLPLDVRVVGLLAPVDPADPFWAADAEALTPRLVVSETLGPIFTGVAFSAGEALNVLANDLQAPLDLEVRVPLVPDRIAARDPAVLVPQLSAATARGVPLASGTDLELRATTQLDEVLVEHLAKRRPVQALTSLLLVALLGAAAAVVLLASQLLLERRRGTLALAGARGASARQSLAFLAVEGLLLGVPAAVLGALLAVPVPGNAGGWGIVLPALMAVGPAVAVVVCAIPAVRTSAGGRRAGAVVGAGRGAGGAGGLRGLRRETLDRAGRTAGPVLLVGLAVLAALALRQRGLDVVSTPPGSALDPLARGGTEAGARASSGPDLLVVAAPALLAAVIAVVVGRASGPVLALATRRTARSSGSVAFLGLARASRGSAGGALTLLAVALALAATLFAAVTAVTADRAARSAAQQATGAPLVVTGPDLRPAELQALARLPGVSAVVPVARPGEATLTGAGPRDVSAELYPTDAPGLATVQEVLTDVPGLPAELAQRLAPPGGPSRDGPLPVLVSQGLVPVGSQVDMQVRARVVPVVVVGAVPRLPGIPPGDAFVVAQLQDLRERASLVLPVEAAFIRADPVPDEAAVRAAAPSLTDLTSPALLEAPADRSPLVAAVRAGLPAALAVGGALAAAATVLGLLLGARSRSRFIAHLRALGLSRRQSAGLVALEAVPAALTGILAGVVSGVAIAWLVLPAADLRPLTGALVPAPLVVPPLTVMALVTAFLAVVVLSVLGAVAASRAVSPADASRTVEGAS